MAGISGTGKTKLVELFAEALGATYENKQFMLIPVRPDWSDPSDLIGYKELTGYFRAGPLTEVLIEASKPENQEKPYFICLDEMNLARVEHYFSDLLSLMETRGWVEKQIATKPILTRKSMDKSSDQERYGDLFLPENLFIIGTVNMDETTHPFSKKVLDRANTLEFNYIDLNLFPDIDNSAYSNTLRLSSNSFLRSDYLWLTDAFLEYKNLIERTTQQLVQINLILEDVHSHVGFRIRDAVCFYLIYNERFKLMSEDEAFDFQLLQKILPRLQGSSSSIKRVLLKLMQYSMTKKFNIADMMEDPSSLYSNWGSDQVYPDAKYPQSARKIAYMLRRLEEDGFTSFWLS